MATFEYLELPVGATRLRGATDKEAVESHDIRPAPKIHTSLPNPSPPPSPTSSKRRPSLLSSAAASVSSPTMSIFPQLLLSATLPPMTPATPGGPTTSNPRKKLEPERPTLLSSKDPLSLPIMTNNFKRFIMIVGPVFWLQDRVEETVLWKRGWLWTTMWMAAYSLLCFFPRLILLLPHLILIGAILATYPYPPNPTADPLYASDSSSEVPPAAPPAEGSAPWQANIQGIQNLMGAVADLHALVEPYIYHFCLTPAHLTKPPSSTSPSAPRSPYTTQILTILTVTFFPLLFLIHLPAFPIRDVCLVAGLAPFFLTHPYVQALVPVLGPAALEMVPVLIRRAMVLRDTATGRLNIYYSTIQAFIAPSSKASLKESSIPDGLTPTSTKPTPLPTLIQRILDNDRLSDKTWNAEMRQVELWENERYGGPTPVPVSVPVPADSSASSQSTAGAPGAEGGGPEGVGAGNTGGGGGGAVAAAMQNGWAKQNLRQTERSAWTRGRDGWSGVAGAGGTGVEGAGEVSSNLTFSLAPGWAFVETEDWRKDLGAEWSGCGADPDGWVYTNDAWLNPHRAPYTSHGGSGPSVTRRRRWVRRVWYDEERAKEDS